MAQDIGYSPGADETPWPWRSTRNRALCGPRWHERDHLGDELAPDFVTSVVDGGFHGWPYAYIGPNPEPLLNGARPDLVEKTIVPDVLLPAIIDRTPLPLSAPIACQVALPS